MLRLRWQWLSLTLFMSALVLTALSWSFNAVPPRQGVSRVLIDLIDLFSVYEEANLTTLFSGFCLLMVGGVLAWGALTTGERTRAFLALVFVYLALDEWLALHEISTNDLAASNPLGLSGSAWILVFLPLALGVALVALRWWWGLAHWLKVALVLAVLLYLGGAVGLEVIQDVLLVDVSRRTSMLFIHAEELLEMLGAISLFSVLLRERVGDNLRLEVF